MPRYTKLSTYERNTGKTGASDSRSAPCGTLSSSTMIVIRIAITPSLNASSRPLLMFVRGGYYLEARLTCSSRKRGSAFGKGGDHGFRLVPRFSRALNVRGYPLFQSTPVSDHGALPSVPKRLQGDPAIAQVAERALEA